MPANWQINPTVRLLEQEIVTFVTVALLPQPAKPSRKQAHSANQRLITKRKGSAMQASAGAEGRNLWTVNPAKNPPTTQEPERNLTKWWRARWDPQQYCCWKWIQNSGRFESLRVRTLDGSNLSLSSSDSQKLRLGKSTVEICYTPSKTPRPERDDLSWVIEQRTETPVAL